MLLTLPNSENKIEPNHKYDEVEEAHDEDDGHDKSK